MINSPFFKCDRHRCLADPCPDQLVSVSAGVKSHRICLDCEAKLLSVLRSKSFLAFLVRTSMSLGEIIRIDKEKAAKYAAERYREEVTA